MKNILLFVLVLASSLLARADLRYSGATVPEPLVEAALAAYQRGNPGYKLPVVGNGTKAGLRDLCGKRSGLVGTIRKIKDDEARECAANKVRYVEIPVAADAVAVIVSEKNQAVKSLTLQELQTIYAPTSAGKIMRWNQVRNSFPDQALLATGVNIKHGTFGFFHEAIGNKEFVRFDYKDTTDHIQTAKLVAADPNAIGFVPLSVAHDFRGQVRMVSVDMGAGPAVPVNSEEVLAGPYAKLARTIYLYVNADALGAKPADRAFVKFLLEELDNFARYAHLIPLNPKRYQEAVKALKL